MSFSSYSIPDGYATDQLRISHSKLGFHQQRFQFAKTSIHFNQLHPESAIDTPSSQESQMTLHYPVRNNQPPPLSESLSVTCSTITSLQLHSLGRHIRFTQNCNPKTMNRQRLPVQELSGRSLPRRRVQSDTSTIFSSSQTQSCKPLEIGRAHV